MKGSLLKRLCLNCRQFLIQSKSRYLSQSTPFFFRYFIFRFSMMLFCIYQREQLLLLVRKNRQAIRRSVLATMQVMGSMMSHDRWQYTKQWMKAYCMSITLLNIFTRRFDTYLIFTICSSIQAQQLYIFLLTTFRSSFSWIFYILKGREFFNIQVISMFWIFLPEMVYSLFKLRRHFRTMSYKLAGAMVAAYSGCLGFFTKGQLFRMQQSLPLNWMQKDSSVMASSMNPGWYIFKSLLRKRRGYSLLDLDRGLSTVTWAMSFLLGSQILVFQMKKYLVSVSEPLRRVTSLTLY